MRRRSKRRFRISRLKERRRTAVRLIRELPNLIKLIGRLLRDPRVPRFDRILFGVVITYILVPADFIPDFLGVFGFADDLYLIGLSLNRLFSRAGADVLLEHWDGNPRALGYLIEGVEEVGSLLPSKVRRALRSFI